MSSTARPYPPSVLARPPQRTDYLPFTKFSYGDKIYYTQRNLEGNDNVLRSYYNISGDRNDCCNYTFKESCELDGYKSKLIGTFRERRYNRSVGQFELKEKSRKGKYSLKVKYKTDERQVVWGRYLYVEKYVEDCSKILLRGSYISIDWTNQPIHHVITKDVRKIRRQGRSYVSSLRSPSAYFATPGSQSNHFQDNILHFGSDNNLYRVPLEYNVWMNNRHNPIGPLDNIVCEGRRLARSIIRLIQGRGSTPTDKDPMSYPEGTDPSQGLVKRLTERLQRASSLQNSVRMMVNSSPDQRRRQHIPVMSERTAMTRSSPNLASRVGRPDFSPMGPPPSYDSIFSPNVHEREPLDNL